MFKSFFKKKISIADIDVRHGDLSYEGISNDVKVWRTLQGDAVGAYFFDVTPSCPRDLTNDQDLHKFYIKQLED